MTTSRRRSQKVLAQTQRLKAAGAPHASYVAIIGDIIRSRRFTPAARREVQQQLETALQTFNVRHTDAVAAKFVITVGDEFQGLLHDATVIPKLFRHVEMGLGSVEVRFGIGRGVIHTDLKEFAVGMDGPAWHSARAGIEDAKVNRRLGGVFVGFGPEETTLNGFARALHYIRSRLTSKQRELLEALLEDETQAKIAAKAGVSKQAVSKQARAAGGDAYREAEDAWTRVLSTLETGQE